jgi:hypothetical protein
MAASGYSGRMRWWIFGIFPFFLFPGVAFGQVVINEIAWMGIPAEGIESRQWWRYDWTETFKSK